ncbi:MAG: DUF6788 family protein [Cyanobacteria bacterium P01_D01_bin.36]
MPSKRDRLHQQIQRLSLAEKQALRTWLDQQIAEDEKPPEVNPKKDREVVETKKAGRITYQAELVKCGKANCRCATDGQLHGPYWYGYRKQGQKLKSWYVGKKLKPSEDND